MVTTEELAMQLCFNMRALGAEPPAMGEGEPAADYLGRLLPLWSESWGGALGSAARQMAGVR